MSVNDGGPAFPGGLNELHNEPGKCDPTQPGMSLRDYFAGLAMQGFCSSDAFSGYAALARAAYEIADDMLSARSKASDLTDLPFGGAK